MRSTSLAITILVSRRGTSPPAAMETAESSASKETGAVIANKTVTLTRQRAAIGFMAESIADKGRLGALPLRFCDKSTPFNPRRRPRKRRLPHRRWLKFAPFSRMLSMQTNLSAMVCRVRTGWRRDEWAHSPLFICGKTPVLYSRNCRKMSGLATCPHRAILLAGMKERWR